MIKKEYTTNKCKENIEAFVILSVLLFNFLAKMDAKKKVSKFSKVDNRKFVNVLNNDCKKALISPWCC